MHVFTLSPFVAAPAAFSILCPAQDAPGPAAERLLDRMDAARLGKAGRRPDTLAIAGKFRLVIGQPNQKDMVLEGPFRYRFAGTRGAQVTEYPEWGTMRRGYDATLCWEDHPAFGAMVHRGADAAAFRRCFELVHYPGWRTLYVRAERTGTETVDGRVHEVLKLHPAEGPPDVWYLDPQTALPTRIDLDLPGGAGRAQTEWRDWRPVGGMLYAHEQKTTVGAATGVSTLEQVAAGAAVDDLAFAVPDKVRELAAKDVPSKHDCRIEKVEARPAAAIRLKVKPADISRQLAVALPEIMQHLDQIDVAPAGPPFTRYLDLDPDELQIEAGIPVGKAIAAKGRIEPVELPAGKAASTWHVGPYQELQKAYDRLKGWMAEQKLESRGAPWEVYWTDPGLEQDPQKWRTQILWPIR